MRLVSEIIGSFAAANAEILEEEGGRNRLALSRATERLKQRLRQNVQAAGLGRRTANTWQSKEYPAKGSRTLSPAGYVYSKAPLIISAFADGATITGKSGNWLAIPTGAVPKSGGRGGGKRKTPVEVEAHFNRELRLVKPRGGEGRFAFLVMDNLTRARNGRRFRLRTARRAAQGRAAQSVIMFVIVPQVRLKKLLDLVSAPAQTARELEAELQS